MFHNDLGIREKDTMFDAWVTWHNSLRISNELYHLLNEYRQWLNRHGYRDNKILVTIYVHLSYNENLIGGHRLSDCCPSKTFGLIDFALELALLLPSGGNLRRTLERDEVQARNSWFKGAPHMGRRCAQLSRESRSVLTPLWSQRHSFPAPRSLPTFFHDFTCWKWAPFEGETERWNLRKYCHIANNINLLFIEKKYLFRCDQKNS